MTTTPPPDGPPAAPTGTATDDPPGSSTDQGHGPRVNHDEMRDLGRLRRVGPDRKVAGVAGGLARHLDVDPVILRVAFVVLSFFGGAGVIVYAVCWLLVPVEGSNEAPVNLDERSRTVALVVTGALAVLALLGDSLGGWSFPWPLVLIGLVVLVVTLVRQGRGTPRAHPGPLPSYSYTYDPTAPTPYAAAPAPSRKRGPILFGYALVVTVIGLGVLAMVDLAGVGVAAGAYPALALTVTGAFLLLGAFFGRPGGLILAGLFWAVATAGTTAVAEIDTERVDVAPTSASALQPEYEMFAGELRVDLSEISDLESLDGRTLDLDLELGRIVVVVPAGLDVDVDARVDVGERSLFGDTSGATPRASLDGGLGAPSLTINARTVVGEIVVRTEGSTR